MTSTRVLIAGLAGLLSIDPGELQVLFPNVTPRVADVLGVPSHQVVLGFRSEALLHPASCEEIPGYVESKGDAGICWVSLQDRLLSLGSSASGGALSPQYFIDVKALDADMAVVHPDCLLDEDPCAELSARLDLRFVKANACDVSGFLAEVLPFVGLGYRYLSRDTERAVPLAAGLELWVETPETVELLIKAVRGSAADHTIRLAAGNPLDLIIHNSPVIRRPFIPGRFVDYHSAPIYDLTAKCKDSTEACAEPINRPFPVSTTLLRGVQRNPCQSSFAGGGGAVALGPTLGLSGPLAIAKIPDWIWVGFLDDDHQTPYYDASLVGPPLCPKAVLVAQ